MLKDYQGQFCNTVPLSPKLYSTRGALRWSPSRRRGLAQYVRAQEINILKSMRLPYLQIVLIFTVISAISGCMHTKPPTTDIHLRLQMSDTEIRYASDDGIDSLVEFQDTTASMVMPVPIRNPAPDYPEIARRSETDGEVWVKAWVTKTGTVKRAYVLQTSNSVFNRSALQAIMFWKFKPATANREPIDVWVSIPFRYKINVRSAP